MSITFQEQLRSIHNQRLLPDDPGEPDEDEMSHHEQRLMDMDVLNRDDILVNTVQMALAQVFATINGLHTSDFAKVLRHSLERVLTYPATTPDLWLDKALGLETAKFQYAVVGEELMKLMVQAIYQAETQGEEDAS